MNDQLLCSINSDDLFSNTSFGGGGGGGGGGGRRGGGSGSFISPGFDDIDF